MTNNINAIFPIVMAGGSGSRLWPLSRASYPKQFLNMFGAQSLLQETLERVKLLDCFSPIVICNEEHRFLAAEQIRKIGMTDASLVLEPIGRNTAPTVALGALLSQKRMADSLILVLAADHLIHDNQEFKHSIEKAIPHAKAGKIVTFGINPTAPEIGYGYIKIGSKVSSGFKVNSFVEKPDYNTALKYLESGDYYWNSGIFLMRADVYLDELKKYAPSILDNCEKAIDHASRDLDFIRIDPVYFESCPSESIDYAVIEKTKDVVVIPMDSGWNDIGSWASFWAESQKDNNNNVLKGDVIVQNSANSLIYADNRLVAAVGVDNLIIIETKDAILVCRKGESQNIKKIVEQLKNNKRYEHMDHREVYRPWGKYDSIDVDERYRVKRITVNPGQKLSVQMHYHRAEHWIIVSGTALVGLGDEEMLLSENQSVYIPLGEKHYLRNPGKIPLELIEVQSGAYLEEDDIVRFEDIYGRS